MTKPRYVLVDSELRHVSEFAALLPRQRPESICPVCKQEITLKLGQEREHHYAHRPGTLCPTTRPETALHLNCKLYLAQQLRQVQAVNTLETCSICEEKQRTHGWIARWDEVIVE
ncbi:MAG: hypothetical protein GY796_22970 [Chloroflexi bacterium]|nr:hypothetical protein [Chloroflexota bacterium]